MTASRLDDLTAMRELLWESLKQADPDKRAPLFARLESVITQIEALSPAAPQKGDAVDEIAERRAARGAGSAKSRRRTSAHQG